MPGKKGMKHYPQSIKELAVRMRLEEHKSTTEVMAALGINDRWRINKWCYRYRKYGSFELPTAKPQGRPRKTARTEQQQLEYEVTRLRMEVELLKNILYEAERM